MITSTKIAVLGGGNAAHTMAADLTLKGYEVNMCEVPEFVDSISTTLERQAIDLIDAAGEKHTVKIHMVTTDFSKSLKDVNYIMMAMPAIGSKRFFEAIMPYLKDGQTVIKWSSNFSALSFAKMLRDKGIKKDITFAESHTMPWGCRLVMPGVVQIMVWQTKLLFAALPANNTKRVIKDIKKMYPVVAGENVLATSLNNLNPVCHPVGTVMNAGWIDTLGKGFSLNSQGSTYSIAKGVKRVFDEVSKVAKAYSVNMIEYPEEDFWRKSMIMSSYARAMFDKESAVQSITGPSSVKSRYLTEDVPYGLVPIANLARKFNIPIPFIDAVIEFSSVINQTDYMAQGISLEELGIADFRKNELLKVLREGF